MPYFVSLLGVILSDNEFSIWELIAGLGIFLFGMYLMEESVKRLSGRKLKYFIRKFTSTNSRGVLSGMAATAILQSSSAVSLMILAFVGAGIMTLGNAFAVIIGSNIGTTVTSWIVASIGFKVNIDALALPFIGIGGLMLIFLGGREKTANISKLLVGFGFLFLGLNYMKTSMEILAVGLDLSQYAGANFLWFFIIGFIITAAIQSSSATMAIILTSVHSGIIDISGAAVMIIGANVGTTITVVIGAIGGDAEKKRVAMSHFLFNFVTGIIALAFHVQLIYVVFTFFGLSTDPVIGMAVFHTMFKLLGFIIFFPSISLFSRLIKKIIPIKKDVNLVDLPDTLLEVPEAALEAFRHETKVFVVKVIEYNRNLLHIPENKVAATKYNLIQAYESLKLRQGDLFIFSQKLRGVNLGIKESAIMHNYLHTVKFAMASAKSLKDIEKDIEEIRSGEQAFIRKEVYEYIKKAADKLYKFACKSLVAEDTERYVDKLISRKRRLVILDEEITGLIAEFMKQGHVQRDQLLHLLSINRNFHQSNLQLIDALRDFKLSEYESVEYERL